MRWLCFRWILSVRIYCAAAVATALHRVRLSTEVCRRACGTVWVSRLGFGADGSVCTSGDKNKPDQAPGQHTEQHTDPCPKWVFQHHVVRTRLPTSLFFFVCLILCIQWACGPFTGGWLHTCNIKIPTDPDAHPFIHGAVRAPPAARCSVVYEEAVLKAEDVTRRGV